jgi:phytoene/squalene synthetase
MLSRASRGALRPLSRTYVAPASSALHCVETTRDLDRERYICNLLLPARARSHAFAACALNAELARVRDSVTEPKLRQVRLQWWRDAVLEAARGTPAHNPLAESLAAALAQHPLMQAWLLNLVSAREADLQITTQPATDAWVDEYAESTAGALIHCALEAAGVGSDAAHEAATHIGRAHGLATLLRGTPVHASQGYTFLPATLTEAHGVRLRDLLSGRRTPALAAAVEVLAERARASLRAGDALARTLPAEARAALAPAAVAGTYLAALREAKHDVFDPKPRDLRLRLLGSLVARKVLGWPWR